ncbi:erythromycin esterase family protein [Streptomyces sp. NBC_00654]|uniref:erythromycin esterase family protein n=1 Tax=Streptomyces sp. NBC_00654 TaxID=2975799 RepID=UPI00225ADC6D|nr:erythromycin esterase family protein [Streptomyces sp. NBC_00654]MCX4965324.1 erythromycin esterase family protein [Streptomyces sp. NBC_00654]
MPAATDRPPFADWLHSHATRLSHLDPEAPLDDLEPLRDILGGARVVALGEHSHFIGEFAMLRRRVLRFLVERCGFTVLAFEYGFGEGFPLDAWAHGRGTDDDLAAHLAAAVPIGLQEPLRYLRRHNRTAVRPVSFAGIDIPAAGGSLLPALVPVADYLRRIDPESLPTVRAAMTIAESFAGDSAAVAAPAWARLAAAEQDTLSALLARLLIRFRSLAPLYVSRGDRQSYDIALRCLEGAGHADYTFRAMAALFTGDGLTADTSARDLYMAESLLWHLNRLGPTARVVLAAHNAHIQKTPIVFDGRLTGLPMGQHLHNALGDAYFALALTSATGYTAEMHRDEKARFGFTIADTALEAPEPGSIEAAFADSGPGLGFADLRRARTEGLSGPDRIRMQSVYVHTPVLDAFDGVLSTPASTVADVTRSWDQRDVE